MDNGTISQKRKMKNKHNLNVGSEIQRSDERIELTAGIFTPLELCEKLIDENIPEDLLKNPNSTFIDQSAGNGNFLVSLQKKLSKYHSIQHINDHMLYAVELMKDNHTEMCKRLGVSADHYNFVCANALEYHYEFNGSPSKITLDCFEN